MTKRVIVSAERKAACWKYWDTPFSERMKIVPFRKSLHIGSATFRDLKREYDNERDLRLIENTEVMVNALGARQKNDSTPITDEEILTLRRKLYIDAMASNAGKGDKELAARSLGLLVDKSEVTHFITPEIIEKSKARADADLHEDIDGVYKVEEELSDKPPELEGSN